MFLDLTHSLQKPYEVPFTDEDVQKCLLCFFADFLSLLLLFLFQPYHSGETQAEFEFFAGCPI